MAPSSQQHLLKIFTGPHTGAEVLLTDGEYTLGSDDSADIILTDHLISPHHVRLTISGSEVSCATIESAGLLVDGTSVTGSELQPYQYFTLGSTHLAIGPADSGWPVTTFPEFRLGGNPGETEATTPENESTDEELAESETEVRRRSAFWIPATIALLLFGGVSFFFIATSGSGEPDEATEPVADQVRRVIQEAGVPEGSLTLKETDRGHLLTGYVAEKDTRRKLTSDIRAISRSVSLKVRDLETLMFLTNDFLQRRKLPLNAEHGGQPGEIIVSGEVEDIAVWHAAKPRLTVDVPAISAVVDNVKTQAGMMAKVIASPAAGHTEPEPSTADVADDTVLQDMDPTLTLILKQLVADRKTESNTEPGAEETTTVSPEVATGFSEAVKADETKSVLATLPRDYVPESVTIPLLYRSVSVGGERSITMNDGQKVFVGARLDNGYTVTDIRSDRILLADSRGEKVHFLENQR